MWLNETMTERIYASVSTIAINGSERKKPLPEI